MNNICTYCNSLKVAIDGDHQCSVNGITSTPESIGNSFYVKSNSLRSGDHVSRFTFRTVFSGYQYYQADNKDYRLNLENYLIINNGVNYHSEIRSSNPTESLIVAFAQHAVSEVATNLNAPHSTLLDQGLTTASDNQQLFDGTYTQNPVIEGLARLIAQAIIEEKNEPLYFQQLQYALMAELVINHQRVLHKMDSIQSERKATKIELYKRTSTAKDYIEAFFHKKINLDQLGKVANMSTFHFLRSFKQIFGITPMEYLTKVRLDYAGYLLKNSDLSIQEITTSCGFESPSSFGRLFRTRQQMTPTQFRSTHEGKKAILA